MLFQSTTDDYRFKYSDSHLSYPQFLLLAQLLQSSSSFSIPVPFLHPSLYSCFNPRVLPPFQYPSFTTPCTAASILEFFLHFSTLPSPLLAQLLQFSSSSSISVPFLHPSLHSCFNPRALPPFQYPSFTPPCTAASIFEFFLHFSTLPSPLLAQLLQFSSSSSISVPFLHPSLHSCFNPRALPPFQYPSFTPPCTAASIFEFFLHFSTLPSPLLVQLLQSSSSSSISVTFPHPSLHSCFNLRVLPPFQYPSFTPPCTAASILEFFLHYSTLPPPLLVQLLQSSSFSSITVPFLHPSLHSCFNPRVFPPFQYPSFTPPCTAASILEFFLHFCSLPPPLLAQLLQSSSSSSISVPFLHPSLYSCFNPRVLPPFQYPSFTPPCTAASILEFFLHFSTLPSPLLAQLLQSSSSSSISVPFLHPSLHSCFNPRVLPPFQYPSFTPPCTAASILEFFLHFSTLPSPLLVQLLQSSSSSSISAAFLHPSLYSCSNPRVLPPFQYPSFTPPCTAASILEFFLHFSTLPSPLLAQLLQSSSSSSISVPFLHPFLYSCFNPRVLPPFQYPSSTPSRTATSILEFFLHFSTLPSPLLAQLLQSSSSSSISVPFLHPSLYSCFNPRVLPPFQYPSFTPPCTAASILEFFLHFSTLPSPLLAQLLQSSSSSSISVPFLHPSLYSCFNPRVLPPFQYPSFTPPCTAASILEFFLHFSTLPSPLLAQLL